MLLEEKFLYLCCLEVIIPYYQYTDEKENQMYVKKKSRLLLLSCLVISPVPTIHTAPPQTDELFFLLLTSQACTSPLPVSLLLSSSHFFPTPCLWALMSGPVPLRDVHLVQVCRT